MLLSIFPGVTIPTYESAPTRLSHVDRGQRRTWLISPSVGELDVIADGCRRSRMWPSFWSSGSAGRAHPSASPHYQRRSARCSGLRWAPLATVVGALVDVRVWLTVVHLTRRSLRRYEAGAVLRRNLTGLRRKTGPRCPPSKGSHALPPGRHHGAPEAIAEDRPQPRAALHSTLPAGNCAGRQGR